MISEDGCETCDEFWFRFPRKRPYELAANSEKQISLYRCPICNSFWLESQRSARIISKTEAQELFPRFDLSM
jgi:Zn-finger nucleic acid-binding protein